jgi:nicotinamide riboside kinase
MMTGLRIVATGPESTGKSALTAFLANSLHLPAANEYARIHLESNGPSYDYPLLLDLSRWHKAYQRACVPDSAPVGFLDTDLINYKIWCEVVYGKCHQEIIAAMEEETNHVYLLCFPNLPWQPDPLRENPDDRLMLFDRHLAEIERLKRPYVIIRGSGEDRYQAARNAALGWL